MLLLRHPSQLDWRAAARSIAVLSFVLICGWCSSSQLHAQSAAKKIVFLAGTPSHGYGSHEHLAGARLLAAAIEAATDGVVCEVIGGAWPQDDSILDGADSIVMYCDGGGRHPALKHLDVLAKHLERGAGFVCLHYAVEVPKEQGGTEFLKWLGGYFETHWSVNPHWTAEFTTLPEHPVTRGVQPFAANDEWYFHMRFQPEMQGVTPILSAVPPLETMRRPDGPHSGNPTVREEVEKQLPQHVAWVYERPSTERAPAGRSFGFTGGHYHWNWGRQDILRLVANAILWTAHAEVPSSGLPVVQPSLEQLEQGQDEPVPERFNAESIRKEFKLSSLDQQQTTAPKSQSPVEPRELFASEVITSRTPGHAVQAKVEIGGVETLYLVVTDAGNGYACDWADWCSPTLIGNDGRQLSLTDVEWITARSQWGQVHKGKNAAGQPLSIDGVVLEEGIGTHANSLIGFKLPEGYQQLQVTCGLDDGGTRQAGGQQSSVRFRVFANAAPANLESLDGKSSDGDAARRDPAQAVAGLTIHPDLEVTLVASEPSLLSLTNLDVDHRGRIWVCEVVNYRRHNGERPEGDRILILEDTDQDGRADSSKVYYQGRDIDSAMGICVLGNKVIVSASPNVWVFTDEDGDDRPDRKELFFSNTGQAQHDHSAHSFLFGPDGKLYWNFGNTGKAVHDAQGQAVVDRWGHTVIDNGKPYYGGMAFRCNLDGSAFEVLAHNFRNNYEVTVDSFGTLWQSDNDDDGNRATRINYVMEFGNFGYLDELTGAGWRTPRTNLEETIPEQHWHLNDPGVVPTMLITGAGSPTGITVYEGDLLPEVFRNQVIHCDAGPNVVRAYPTTVSGAGYTASVENLMVGEQDRWFRPADVCVAPDGSLFVTDWYDPGVGGHQMVDTERGRLFRLAPPGTPYQVPKFDFSTVAGAVEALRNSNQSVRYLAWQALQRLGPEAQLALERMATDANPRMRARALWALGKLPGNNAAGGSLAVASALADKDPNIRVLGVRLARQLNMDAKDFAARVLSDPAPPVRRELALALRHSPSEQMPRMWAALAAQHDDADRWYLEALGIGAELRWNECFQEYLRLTETKSMPVSHDIVWRARTSLAAPYIAKILADPTTSPPESLRMLRTLDYHPEESRESTLRQVIELVRNSPSRQAEQARSDAILVACLLRLSNGRVLSEEADLAASISRMVATAPREQQLEILRKLKVEQAAAHLLRLATEDSLDSIAVSATEALLMRKQTDGLLHRVHSDSPPVAQRAAAALAAARPPLAFDWLTKIVEDQSVVDEARVAAAKGLAGSEAGAKYLLELTRQGHLPSAARFVVGSLLRASEQADIRDAAVALFPAPTMKAKERLPELAKLVELKGNATRGAEIFKTTGTCANCHVLKNEGKNVGPDLSEIGSKLAKESLYISILDPSAGISHNYESYAALTASGQVIVGLLVSQTDDAVTLKDAQGIERTIPRDELDDFKKLDKSLMPENVIESLSTSDLIDLVEFLTTLRSP